MRARFLPLICLVYVLAVAVAAIRGWPAGGRLEGPESQSIPHGLLGSDALGESPLRALSGLGPFGSLHAVSRQSHIAKERRRGEILMYHYVRSGVDPAKDRIGYNLSVPPSQLGDELAYLSSHGYRPTVMADLAAGRTDYRSVALTFDDGYEDFYVSAWPLLKKYRWTATVFVISGKVGLPGYLTWDQIRELQAAGIEIGAHTVTHADLATSGLAKQRYEIGQSKRDIEAALGRPIYSFCYPSGRYTDVTAGLVRQAGYTSATTTKNGTVIAESDLFQLPRERVRPGLSAAGFSALFPR